MAPKLFGPNGGYIVRREFGKPPFDTQRMRQMYFVRYFLKQKPKEGKEEISAVLCTFQEPEEDGVQHRHQIGMPFILNDKRKSMEESAKKKNPKFIGFYKFSVIVSSLTFIKVRFLSEMTHEAMLEEFFFSEALIKQWGTHLFVNFTGDLKCALTYVTSSKPPEYVFNKSVPVVSIYPVMRYAWDETQPGTQLTYGIHYSNKKDDKKVKESPLGNRYYHRFGEECLKVGNVFELTKLQLGLFKQVQVAKLTSKQTSQQTSRHTSEQTPEESSNYCILYVCTGAKLVVVDNYQDADHSEKHNRSFVQQGGIVICEGKIKIGVPFIKKKEKLEFDKKEWKEFCETCLRPVDKNYTPPDPTNFENPVIFLGANDSYMNSIAWDLNVEAIGENKFIRLLPPEGARIIAIEDGVKGIEEIEDRIRYEMLHDSVLTNHSSEWSKPKGSANLDSYAMAKKIMNVNDSRSFDVRNDKWPKSSDLDPREIPKEFNTSTIVDDTQHVFDKTFEHFFKTQESRPPAPPMYPPATVVDSQGREHTYSVPSSEMPIVPEACNFWPDNKEFKISFEKEKGVSQYSGWYGYSQSVMKAYHYNMLNAFVNLEALSGYSSTEYRYGVDGWMWQKVGTQPIYYERKTIITKKSSTTSEPPATQNQTRGLPPQGRQPPGPTQSTGLAVGRAQRRRR